MIGVDVVACIASAIVQMLAMFCIDDTPVQCDIWGRQVRREDLVYTNIQDPHDLDTASQRSVGPEYVNDIEW